MQALVHRLASRRIVLLVGSGGVGKTTTSAALALNSALSGQESLVLTIDPAARLAQALGLPHLPPTPERIDLSVFNKTPAPLWAMMLDVFATFDQMAKEAVSAAEYQALLASRLYRYLARELSGMHEYMAVSQLQYLNVTYPQARIFMDTPPTVHVLDFLEAPHRFNRFFEHEFVRFLLQQAGHMQQGRLRRRLMNFGLRYMSQALSAVGGEEILQEIAAFLVAFQPIFSHFKQRAVAVESLFSSADVGFVLVSGPLSFQVDEALMLYQQLVKQGHVLDAVVVNRMPVSMPQLPPPSALAAWIKNPACHNEIATLFAYQERRRQEAASALSRLRESIQSTVPVFTVLEQTSDVHHLQGLCALSINEVN